MTSRAPGRLRSMQSGTKISNASSTRTITLKLKTNWPIPSFAGPLFHLGHSSWFYACARECVWNVVYNNSDRTHCTQTYTLTAISPSRCPSIYYAVCTVYSSINDKITGAKMIIIWSFIYFRCGRFPDHCGWTDGWNHRFMASEWEWFGCFLFSAFRFAVFRRMLSFWCGYRLC